MRQPEVEWKLGRLGEHTQQDQHERRYVPGVFVNRVARGQDGELRDVDEVAAGQAGTLAFAAFPDESFPFRIDQVTPEQLEELRETTRSLPLTLAASLRELTKKIGKP